MTIFARHAMLPGIRDGSGWFICDPRGSLKCVVGPVKAILFGLFLTVFVAQKAFLAYF